MINNQVDNTARWNSIIDHISGSCEDLYEYLENNAEDLIDYLPFLEYLDNYIFRCEQCGWWHPVAEMAVTEDVIICDDCYSDY